MISERQALAWSNRCYGALLWLYPVEFRVRYGKEMAQVFHYCCRDRSRREIRSTLGGVWVYAIADLALSIPRERLRAFPGFGESPFRTGSVVDSMLILSIIAFHLLSGGAAIVSYAHLPFETFTDFVILSSVAAVVLGGMGVTCSLFLARFRRVHYRVIQL